VQFCAPESVIGPEGAPVLLSQLVDRIVARVVGPMHFRFILQPVMAVFLGVRDGRRDARAGAPPFLYNILFVAGERTAYLESAVRGLTVPALVGIVADAAAQFLLFGSVRPSTAFLVGVGVLAVPYAVARELTNRFSRWKRRAKVLK